MSPARPTRADLGIAMLLAALAACLYSRTVLGRVYGNDGAMLGEWTALPERAYWQYHNTLYLPAAWLLDRVLPRGLLVGAGDPLALAKSLSLVAAAIGVACTYACCRLLGAARWPCVAGTVLLATAPVTWFFASAIEVHTLHFAVVSACALATLAAPWHRPVTATVLTAIAFVLPCLSHQSAPALGPGWVLLVQCARTRTGAPFRLPALFWIGTALLGAVLLGSLLVHWRRGMGVTIDLGTLAATVGGWRRAFTPAIVWTEVLAPLGMLVPAAAFAAGWRAVDSSQRWCAAAMLLPLIGCVVWWGVPERGGYLLGPSFLLAALAAAVWTRLPRTLAVTTAIVAIAVQAWAGWRQVRDFDSEGFQLTDRVEVVRRHLGATGLLVSANDNAPAISIWLPQVRELALLPTLANTAPVDAWAAAIQQLLAGERSFAVDVSYRLRGDLPDRVRDGMQLLEAAWRRDHQVVEHDDPSWPLLLVTGR